MPLPETRQSELTSLIIDGDKHVITRVITTKNNDVVTHISTSTDGGIHFSHDIRNNLNSIEAINIRDNIIRNIIHYQATTVIGRSQINVLNNNTNDNNVNNKHGIFNIVCCNIAACLCVFYRPQRV